MLLDGAWGFAASSDVTKPEIERVVNFLKQHGRPRYEKIPFRSKKAKDEQETFEHDEKYDETKFSKSL